MKEIIQEHIFKAKADAVEEFFRAVFYEKKADEDWDLEELLDWIYCLHDQMVGYYSDLAEENRLIRKRSKA